MLSSGQGIGLMAVIAVSGGVALIALGCHKKKLLLVHGIDAKPSPEDGDEERRRGLSTPHAQLLEFRPSKVTRGLDRHRSAAGYSVSHVQDEKRKKRIGVKRVRFSDDVIEPCGDGKEYRRRQMAARLKQAQQRSGSRRDCKALASDTQEAKREATKNSCMPENRRVMYQAMRQLHSQRMCSLYY